MRIVLQRVTDASLRIDGQTRACIETGLVALVGFWKGDTDDQIRFLADKVANLRIFPDQHGRMNHSVRDIDGAVLAVPNFTLAADARKGRRPSFDHAMPPDEAAPAFERFCDLLASHGVGLQRGVFGAHMLIHLTNDGPVTIILEA